MEFITVAVVLSSTKTPRPAHEVQRCAPGTAEEGVAFERSVTVVEANSGAARVAADDVAADDAREPIGVDRVAVASPVTGSGIAGDVVDEDVALDPRFQRGPIHDRDGAAHPGGVEARCPAVADETVPRDQERSARPVDLDGAAEPPCRRARKVLPEYAVADREGSGRVRMHSAAKGALAGVVVTAHLPRIGSW
jgi:hypothetical protein